MLCRIGCRSSFIPPQSVCKRLPQIVVANILANPLIVLEPLLAALTVNGGNIALSGILAEQADEVAAAYARDYALAPPTEEGGWVLITGTRRAAA